MTEDAFKIGIDMLVAATRPYRWTPDSANAYWKVFNRYEDDEFVSACTRIISKSSEMPSIPQLAAEMGARKTHHQDCDLCRNGRVFFVVSHQDNGNTYERFAACSCEAGNATALVMSSMAKSLARSNGNIARNANPEDFKWENVKVRLHSRLVHEERVPVPEKFKRRPLPARPGRQGHSALKGAFDALMGDRKGDPK